MSTDCVEVRKNVRRAVKATPPTVKPCEGCKHARRCEDDELACEALVLFRRVSTSQKRWGYAPRIPTEALHDLAFAPLKPTAPVKPAWGRKRHIEEVEPEAEAVDAGEDDWDLF